MSQSTLYRSEQIPTFIDILSNGLYLDPITLIKNSKNEIQVEDGHHRLSAIWLTGRKTIQEHEYIIVYKEFWKPNICKIEFIVERKNNGR